MILIFFFSGFQGCLTVVTDFVGLFDVKYFRNFFFFARSCKELDVIKAGK